MGEKSAASGQQHSDAEVGTAHTWVMAGRKNKEVDSGVGSSGPLHSKEGPLSGREDVNSSRVQVPQNITAGSTADENLDAPPSVPNKLSGSLYPTAKGADIPSVPATSNVHLF